MLSLTKKSDEPVAAPLWHANFRNFERLPDTKVVRTTFFVNTLAGAVALALLLWLGYGEYRLNNLSEQIASAQRDIDANTAKNNAALAQTKTFTDESARLAAAAAFLKMPVGVSEYIQLLAQTLPKEISIDFVDMRIPADPRGQAFLLRCVVAGSRDQAAGSASAYVESLKAHPRIGAVFDPISLDKLTPDGGTGFMSIEISLKVKPEAKK